MKLRELERTSWLPVTEEGDGPVTASKFSGTPYLAPGESWPTCPRCGEPMALFLQLDLGALPDELGGELGSGLLQMFYCVSRRDCPIRGEGRLEPFSPYQLLRRVCPSPGGPPPVPPTFDLELPARRITGWEPVEDYPDRPSGRTSGSRRTTTRPTPSVPWGTSRGRTISSSAGPRGRSTSTTRIAVSAVVNSGRSSSSSPTRTSGTCSGTTVTDTSPAAPITPTNSRSSGPSY